MFKDKVTVITGGSHGIGLETAKAFMENGAKVAVIDINTPDEQFDLFYQGDIAKESHLNAFVEQVTERFGKVDYLINNACISRGGILSGCSYDDFLYVQKVGVVAPYMLTTLLEPTTAIVNISSTRANQSQPDTESYTSAKGGITALTHALAISLSGKVRVNCISPGWIDTTRSEFSGADNTQHPSGRVGKPKDIADMVLYLCSDKAQFINGQNITIDGGMSKQMIYHNDHGWKLEE